MTRKDIDEGRFAWVMWEEHDDQFPGGRVMVAGARLLVERGFGQALFETVEADYSTVWTLPDGRRVAIGPAAVDALEVLDTQKDKALAQVDELAADVRGERYDKARDALIGLCVRLDRLAKAQEKVRTALDTPAPDTEARHADH